MSVAINLQDEAQSEIEYECPSIMPPAQSPPSTSTSQPACSQHNLQLKMD